MDQASTNSRIVTHATHTTLTALSTILPPTPWVSLAEGLLFGLPAGFLMAVLVALRVSGSLGDVLLVFLGAWGLHGLMVGTASGILRICRPLPSRSPTFVWAVLLAVLPLARLGTLLAERTHHRPLGATTFALVALVIILGFWACAARAFGMRRSAHRHNRLFGTVVLGLLVVVSVLVGAAPVLAWFGEVFERALLASALIDGLLGASLIVIGGFVRFGIRIELVARMAGPLSVGICSVAFLIALRSEVALQALSRVSALFGLFLR